MSLLHLYNNTMNVYSITETQSVDSGGLVETETLQDAAVPCLLDVIRGHERELLGREGVVATHWIFCDTGITLTEKHRIKIGSRVFDLQKVDDIQERGHHREVLVEERV